MPARSSSKASSRSSPTRPIARAAAKTWLKSKCGMEQEFVIIGWRPSDKPRRPFSSILLAVREDEQAALRRPRRQRLFRRPARGISARSSRRWSEKTPPVDDVPRDIARQAKFVEPELVAEIEFRGWTRDNLVRQGAFKGLRGDKPATRGRQGGRNAEGESGEGRQSRGEKGKATKPRATFQARERPTTARKRSPACASPIPIACNIRTEKVTKRDLIEHYLSIADHILPHVAERPLSLVRCPDGIASKCFFQKHASDGFPDLFEKVQIREKSGSDDYLFIRDERGLVAAVQMGVLELHHLGLPRRRRREAGPDGVRFRSRRGPRFRAGARGRGRDARPAEGCSGLNHSRW